MSRYLGKGGFVRLLGSAVVSQAVISAGNLLVGLILIRRQSDVQYGYYVLVVATLLLLTGLQVGFLQPPMIVRLARFDEAGRRDLIGGLLREQRRFVLGAGGIVIVLAGIAWLGDVLPGHLGLLVIAAAVSAMATLNREFFRMVLQGYRRPIEVLQSDLVYAILLVAGAYLATFAPMPAATAVLTLSFAALVGGTLLRRALWRVEPWNIRGAPRILPEIAPVGAWSVAGAGIHWAFNQGYTYLVAALLDVQSVAAIAATRLLVMPVNLLSTGIYQMLLPTASNWLQQHGVVKLFRRLLLICAAVSVLAVAYFVLMWLLRDWIFLHILKKNFAQRDALLLLWSLIFLCALMRDQLAPLLVARSRMPQLTMLTTGCAALALTCSYVGIGMLGVTGALVGVLAGEALNVIGIGTMSRVETRRLPAEPGPAAGE